jgi:hypothetical protein
MGLRFIMLLVSLSVVATTSACGGSQEGATEAAPSPSAPPAPPSPQSAEAREALRQPNSAASTVVAYWRYVGTGALPAAYELYDDRIASVFDDELAGGLALHQATVAATDFRVYEIEETTRGTVVLAESFPDKGPKSQWSFFLRRSGQRWQIIYDTFTANALGYYVQREVQQRIDPDAQKPSREALDAAEGAVARFRKAALGSAGVELPSQPS